MLLRAREQLDEWGRAEEKAEYALLSARLVVHGDHPETVVDRLDDLERLAEGWPARACEVQVIRIHALVARGQELDAVRLIRDFQQRYPEVAREALARPAGPATALAAELARTSAYR
jgi:hypothetical protein